MLIYSEQQNEKYVRCEERIDDEIHRLTGNLSCLQKELEKPKTIIL